MIRYVTVDTTTLAGLKKAEWYHALGWKIARDGLFTIQFYKKTS